MKNIYKITKGQLISVWIFGIIGFIVSLGEVDYSGFATFLSIIIPAILVFYTIGWRSNNKTIKEESNKQSFEILSILPTRKMVIISSLAIIIIILVIIGINYLIDKKEDKIYRDKLSKEYNQAIIKIDSLKDKVTSCKEPVFQKLYTEEVRSCNLLKNKIKSDYNSCLGYSSHDYCIYTHDYEKIDCSDKSLKGIAIIKVYSSLPYSCDLLVSELSNTEKIIKEYSELNIK